MACIKHDSLVLGCLPLQLRQVAHALDMDGS